MVQYKIIYVFTVYNYIMKNKKVLQRANLGNIFFVCGLLILIVNRNR